MSAQPATCPQQHQCPQAMVIPDCPDASGAFAIHHAAQGGHSGVLELLLLLQSSSSSVSTEVCSDGAAGPVSSATAASVEGGRGRRRFDVEARTANGFRTALQVHLDVLGLCVWGHRYINDGIDLEC